jgi:hypothetical protein
MGWTIYRGCHKKALPGNIYITPTIGRPRRRWLDVWMLEE